MMSEDPGVEAGGIALRRELLVKFRRISEFRLQGPSFPK